MSIAILSTSLNPESRSDVLASYAANYTRSSGIECVSFSLKANPLPICDGDEAYSDPNVQKLKEIVEGSKAILFACPVYVYGVSAAAKNVPELVGRSMTGKPVGIMSAAGGKGSLMAPMGLANSLMLDFRCPVVPKMVYADSSFFGENNRLDESIESRIEELVLTLNKWAQVL